MLCKHTQVKMVGRCAFKSFLILLVVSGFLTCSMRVMGAEIQSKVYSIVFPVDLDFSNCIPISLGIKCDVQEYDMAFSDFVSKENGAPESRLKELVLAIDSNDVKKCQGIALLKPGIGEIFTPDEKVKNTLPGWRSWAFNDAMAGKDLEKLKVFNQLYLGRSRVFTLGGNGTEPFRPMLSFEADSKGTYMWDITNPGALQSVLGDIMRFKAVSSPNSVSLENRKFDYEVAIPDTNDTGHVAYLEFNGEKYDFNVFSDTIVSIQKPTDEVVSFFQKKYLMLRNGCDRAALGELYTDKSRQKYLQSIKKPVSPSYTDWMFKDWATREKRVVFVMDAKPLYIVFCQMPGLTSPFYSYIIRDPKDSQLKLTNYNCSGFLDDLFLKLTPFKFLQKLKAAGD